jgi:hypothetical protein
MMTEEAKPKRKYVRKESAVKIESGWEAVSALVETCDNTVRVDTRIKPTMYLVIFPVNKISYEDMKLAIDAQDFFSSDEKVFYIPTVNEESYVREYWNSIENTRHVIRYNPTRYNELAARKFVEYQNVFGSEAKVLYIPNSTDAMIYETIV